MCCAVIVTSDPSRRLVRGVLGAVLLVQVLALYLPQSPGPPPPFPHSDKVVHALLFAAPVLVAGLGRLSRWWLVILVCAVHAPVSEAVQHLAVPGRSGDLWDLVADLLGLCLGWAGVAWVRRRPRRRRL